MKKRLIDIGDTTTGWGARIKTLQTPIGMMHTDLGAPPTQRSKPIRLDAHTRDTVMGTLFRLELSIAGMVVAGHHSLEPN